MSRKIYGLIPARMESQRLPGKPLADIAGWPMLYHVVKRAKMAQLLCDVFVCTDSPEIVAMCESFSFNVCLTSSGCKNGTERIAEAVGKMPHILPDDIVIDIQGDEPLLDPANVNAVAETSCSLGDEFDIVLPFLVGSPANDENVVKVVESEGRVHWLSRRDLPFSFGNHVPLKKHLSIIGFTRKTLLNYSEFAPTPNEIVEGIELLRAIESGMSIRSLELSGDSFSVDVSAQLESCRLKMERCPLFISGY